MGTQALTIIPDGFYESLEITSVILVSQAAELEADITDISDTERKSTLFSIGDAKAPRPDGYKPLVIFVLGFGCIIGS
ncbi:hypothetical protein FRX31_032953 [Thalictrum thalictroides]|uniref:Uncharacterized protein n=1 Tax=Thalictrum thalictroides TaxID=46969 RepID=A0A7J6UZH6_THATH|nr:hypothetical protein FRX31_032953 [Thalictrum thalictroides]